MLNLKRVAVTGGLSSGKSTVCRLFKQLGAYVVSADEVVHQLLSSDPNTIRNVVNLLGSDIMTSQGIDRSKVADKVFKQPKLLRSLENILHPAVRDEINEQFEKAQLSGKYPLFVAEIPLFYESQTLSQKNNFDAVIAVIADKEISRQRFNQIKKYDSQEFNLRWDQQMDPAEKQRRADIIITNEGTLDDLRISVENTWAKLAAKPNN
jgi:dephospho-CoA kinase